MINYRTTYPIGIQYPFKVSKAFFVIYLHFFALKFQLHTLGIVH